MANNRMAFRITPQVVLGFAIIAFGLALTADNIGWMDADEILRYWPLGIVAVGLASLLQRGSRSERAFGAIVLAVGAALTAQHVFRVPIDFWDWWPLGIVALGLLIISKAFGRFGEPGAPTSAAITSAPASTTSDTEISEFAIWSGIQRRVSSPSFKRGDLTAIMGGVEVDLRQAGTSGGEAVIDVFALWGGIEITVPPDWSVSNRVVAIMGGAEDSSTGTQAARHRLVVRGFAVMGGVEIKT